VNLYSFYSYRIIGKLTEFFLQEFIFRNQTVDCSTSAAWHSPPMSNVRLGTLSPRLQIYV
jgi:hypothetical protein